MGFIDGEGCFYVKVINNKYKPGFSVSIFSISQHSRDHLFMNNIISYLNCGIIEKPKGRFEVRFIVYKFNDILVKLIPLNKYPLKVLNIFFFSLISLK